MLIIGLLFYVSVFLVVYHLIIHPLILASLYKKSDKAAYKLSYKPFVYDDESMPEIDLVMPIYNEANVLKEKLWNLISLDYPLDKIHFHLVLDGCTDDSINVIKDCLSEGEFKQFDFHIHDHAINRGKIALLNDCLTHLTSSVVVLTDASALIPISSLRRIHSWFANFEVGAVSSGYRFLSTEQDGESKYWQYQTALKSAESHLGSVIGAHGSCYAVRRELLKPIPVGTINDDFVIPMTVIRAGYRVVYDSEMASIETELSTGQQDFQRRKRLSAGNLHQLYDCIDLLHPRFGWVAFNFFAGKCLRALLPILLLIIFSSNLLMFSENYIYQLLFVGQLSLYLFTATCLILGFEPKNSYVYLVFYLCSGLIASLIGSFQFICGHYNKPWQKV